MRVLRSSDPNDAEALKLFNRRFQAAEGVSQIVQEVIHAVRARGDEALIEYTARFDRATLTPDTLRVPLEDAQDALKNLDPAYRAVLEASHENVRTFAEKSRRQDWFSKNAQGAKVGEIFRPFRRVGIYIPGGSAPLVSTVLMTVSLAAVAGVPEIVVTTPCGPDGSVNPVLLAALALAGATEIYRVGGSQAIAALAWGTETIPQVDKIFGPGNRFVVEAKRQVFGQVSIDLLPGPSEVMVLADETANVDYIAADLLAQAEHGGDSAAILVTPSENILNGVLTAIETQSATLSRQDQLQQALSQASVAILVRDVEEGVQWVNHYSPEHLSLVVENPESWIESIHTAGAIFIGNDSPVAVGDFLAGPSHTLPTGGAGKGFPGLTVDQFQRRTSIVQLDGPSIQASAPLVATFAAIEGLDAHARSATIRTEKGA